MKRIMKLIISAVMLIGYTSYVADASRVNAAISGTCGEGCEFVIEGDTITFSGEGRVYNGMGGQIYDGAAMYSALKPLTNSEYKVPNTNIYSSAQYETKYYIKEIKNIVISEGITNFDYATCLDNVENVTIPSTLIGHGFLSGLPNWKEITITNPENAKLAVKDSILYSKDLTVLHKLPAKTSYKKFEIPEHVTTLDSSIFSNTEIEEVTIGENVTVINNYALCGGKIKKIYTTNSYIANNYEAAKEYAKGLSKLAPKVTTSESQEYWKYKSEKMPAIILAERYDASSFPKLVYTETKVEEPTVEPEKPTEETPKEETEATTPSASGLDLSSYSKMDMNVYPGSRVTEIKANGNGFTVKGYMFEANADCIYNDARNWREVVFVNTEDSSTSKAYRMQVDGEYNTWLNKNMTATANGKYKLNYANYKVVVNPSNINLYAGNKLGHKMTSGTYYVYMRISNGKTSYLFPLKDAVLSDGSTMESKGTLPNGFSVSDDGNRTLLYTVQ